MEAVNIGGELAGVPFGEMITQMATAVANAQAALDLESIEILKKMCDAKSATVKLPYLVWKNGELSDVPMETSMVGAGFQPTFYQFAETIIEVKMAITLTKDEECEKEENGVITEKTTTRARPWFFNRYRTVSTVKTTPIDATYTNKYGFTEEGQSLLRTRLVPVPPNAIIQQQLEMRTQAMQLQYAVELKRMELAIEEKRKAVEKELETVTNGQEPAKASSSKK